MARRSLAALLLLYGVLGLLLVAGGAAVAFGVAARVERLAVTADDALAAAVRTTDAAAASFENVDGSLAEAETSASSAATLARDASGTLDALALAMDLSIFGAQPLAPLGGQFATSADQAEELAGTLDSVASSLSDTRVDTGDVGVELEQLSRELDSLREETGGTGSAPPLRLFVGLLLAWLAMPAVGGLLAGLVLWRRPAAAPPPPSVVD